MVLHAPSQVEVLKERVWPATAYRIVNVAPDEDAGIAVAQAKLAKIRIDPRHLLGGVMIALKDEREISTNGIAVAQRIEDRFDGIIFGSGIGVNKPQCGSCCLHGCGLNLASPSALAGDDSNAEASCDFHRTIIAASVGDEDFFLAAERQKGA